jgi:hypothetical protein
MPLPVGIVDNFTRAEGEQVRHLVGIRCWCHGADGQPDPNCIQHENGGWLFVNEQLITGLVSGIEYRKELMQTGVFMPGDCLFSPTSDVTVSEGDKIIFTWALPYGPGDAMQRGNGDADRLYYAAASAIYCQDEHRHIWNEGVDFRFVGNTIEWRWPDKPTAGGRPATGCRYTIKYKAFIEWLAFAPPVPRISHGSEVGDKVMLRKKHLIER